MSAALARRDDGCASDLLMDRWLLGEIPGSDEGRRLEEHVRGCSGCAARFQALRSLYGSRPPPPAREPLPPLHAPPEASRPEQSAVLQVVILRDGLLVGTEVFTSGRYNVGRDASCALRLEDLEPVHASIALRGERVGLEARGGQVFVNGFRAGSCELRPIDEVAVGPYVLRARVLAERWSKAPLHAVAHASDEPVTVQMRLPAPERASEPPRPAARAQAPLALKLEAFWGDTCVAVELVSAPFGDLSRWDIASAEAGDGSLAVELPRRGRLSLVVGDRARFRSGGLSCAASVVAAPAAVPPVPLRSAPWAVMGLAAALMLCVVGLGIYSANRDLPDFTPHPIPGAVIKVIQQPPKPPPPKVAELTKEKDTKQTKQPIRKPPRAQQQPPPPLVAIKRLTGGKAIKNLLASMSQPMEVAQVRQGPLLAGLGPAPRADASPGLNIGGNGFLGLGKKGKGGGEMRIGNIGKSAVGGQVVDPITGRDVKAPVEVDRDAIAKVIAKHVHEISRCYEQAMMGSGSFGGRMSLEWVILTSGAVGKASVKNTDIKNEKFGSCVLAKLTTWQFPKPRGGSVTIGYPIHVNPVGY